MVRRAIDLASVGLIGTLVLPLLALLTFVIRSDGGPALFRQRRIGEGGRPFVMVKLRTMRVDGDREARWAAEHDPRITRIGRILRATHVDELPQLLNVLRGEMSLVGPRPLPQRDYERLQDWHRKRYLVMPGITGLWQVSGRSNLDFDELVRLDFIYLERWSVLLDLVILLRTIPAVLSRRGAF